MALSSEEIKQYSRHIILDEIGVKGQEKLKNSNVLVIGAGGLGCPVLQYLSAAGIGTIGIIDHDIVDLSNLQRQVIYSQNDIGKHKAQAAADRLSQSNPFVKFDVYLEKLSKENAIELFKKYDIVVDGSDNFPTRYLVNDAAVLTGTPVVFGSIFKFEGQVSVFNYDNGPTYRCLFPNSPLPNEVPNCSEVGVLGVLPGIIGALQANEVIKIITGLGNVLSGKLLMFNSLTLHQSVFNFDKCNNAHISSLSTNYEQFCGISNATEITYSELQNISNYELLDVRTKKERLEKNIGGIHIPLPELGKRVNEIPSNQKIVVYCNSGTRSKTAINTLIQFGLSNELLNLKNGLHSSDI